MQVCKKYGSVFNSLHGVYNGKSGDVQASFMLGKNSPVPKKGKVPCYNSAKAKILQEKFDELVNKGVLSRPEDSGVSVIVHVKEEGTKHVARDFYLVVDVDYGSSTAVIQKFCGNKLQCKRYSLNLSKIYPAASDLIRSTSVVKRNVGNRDDYDDVDDGENDISIFDPEGNSPTVSEDDLDEPLTTSLRRTNRIRKRPDWLATSEIERV